MDFLLLALIGLVLLSLAISNSRLRERVTLLEVQVQHQIRARQGRVRGIDSRSLATPPIDARGRTTQRDADDLPLSGRVRRPRTRMVGGELGVRPDPDR